MSSVDGPFRNANTATKRKLEDPTTSFARQRSSKSVKLQHGASPRTSNGATFAKVEDEHDIGNGEPDIEAGPNLPSDEAGEDFDEDEEGRFFGGGVSKQEREVIDYIERNEAAEQEEKIDLTWLKRMAVNFERKINKNAELRAKFEDEPIKFVTSEADLDAEIKSLSLLGEHPELYADFVRSGCAASLTGLLAHENTDIAISVCEVLAELTDEDSEAEAEQWDRLVDELLKNDIAELLVSNLRRLDENNDSDRAGVYHVLNVLENLLSTSENAEKLGKNKKLIDWLLSRIQKADSDAHASVGQNRQYATEILAILLQSNTKSRTALAQKGGVDILLQQLSSWRRKDPEKDSDEEEFAENLFACLMSLMQDPFAADKFVEEEGVELCLIMLKEGNFAKSGAVRLLDHASGGPQGAAVSERIVENGGLKTIFTTFMKSKKTERDQVEHAVGLFANMLRSLSGESAARIRLLAKFVEKDYEKISRLVKLRAEYASKVAIVDSSEKRDKQRLDVTGDASNPQDWLSRRMDAGLSQLRTLDIIFAWLSAEDGGAKKKIMDLLGTGDGGSWDSVRSSLQEQLDDLEDGGEDEILSSREMLQTLIHFLN